jgi:redox-sensitive bicupin YhaK (pirin superfamily)
MITIRKSSDRGHAEIGWLKAKYSFSFARYYDPRFMGFRSLRVINEDRVAPARGFGTHPHDNMEILTYIISGQLKHQDSTGASAIIGRADVQHMTAGSGIEHSEVNASPTEPVHLLQIWIEPDAANLKPGHEEANFATDKAPHRNRLRLVAAKDPTDGALPVHQDMRLFVATFDPGTKATHTLAKGRHAWFQIVRGSITVNGTKLGEGDGAAISDETTLAIAAEEETEFLLFDLA